MQLRLALKNPVGSGGCGAVYYGSRQVHFWWPMAKPIQKVLRIDMDPF